MTPILKVLITLGIVFACVYVGKRSPSLAGLLATMPLAGLLTLVWLYTDTKGDPAIVAGYTRGAMWGTIPAALFYAVAAFCFRKELPLPAVIAAGFVVWGAAAALHQWFTR